MIVESVAYFLFNKTQDIIVIGDVFSNIFCRHQKILKASVLRSSPQVDGDLNFLLASRVPFDLYYWRHFKELLI